MELDKDQILDRILSPSNPNISTYRDDHQILDILHNGGDVASLLEKVKNFENEEQKELRNKIARSTKDLLAYLITPINKVFSASGFVTKIEAKTETTTKKANDYIEKLPEGVSLRQWMQDFWVPAYISDPNGVILVETNEDGEAYPTIKSIDCIHDFKAKWEDFEYLILLHKKVDMKKDDSEEMEKVQIYRVYDSVKDALYYVKGEGDKAKLYEYEDDEDQHIYIHNLDRVPACFISNIKCTKTGGRKSFINVIDEHLREFLNDSSIHSIYKFLHGFPIFWRYATKCSTCNGTGRVKRRQTTETDDGYDTCSTCNGKKVKITNDVSDGVVIPMPKEGISTGGNDIAGYIQPDLETWGKQVEEMDGSRKEMFFALWGTHLTEPDGVEKTATQAFIDAQPVNDVLWNISNVGESIEEKLMFNILDISFPEMIDEEKIVSKWGRRYLTETPDVLWNKYTEARKDQSPITTLDYLYKRFLMAEYHNAPTMLEQKMKEFYLEPFPHYTLSDMRGIFKPKEIQKKMLFSEWVADDIDFNKEKDVLKAEFEQFVTANMDPIEEPKPGDPPQQ